MSHEIDAVLVFSAQNLIFLHETSPKSPINLSNYADFDQSKLLSVPATHGLTFYFCHSNSTVLFCEYIKDLFMAVFQSVTKDKATEQSLINHIDLCYDILRRMIQFGKINETDPTKLISSVFFNPKNELVRHQVEKTTLSSWFGSRASRTEPKNETLPEINCSISETISYKVKHGRILLSNCIGAIKLSFDNIIPGLQTVLLELTNKNNIRFVPALNVESDSKRENDVTFETSISNINQYLVANYEVEMNTVPINISSKLRLREQDKIIEINLDLESKFPKQYRATFASVLIRTPTQFVNAKLLSDYPTHSMETLKVGDRQLLKLNISNLFGSSSTSACISVAVTDMDFPLALFHTFEVSFEIADFLLAQLNIEKFKLFSLNRKNCAANRKIRTFCHSNKSFILNKVAK